MDGSSNLELMCTPDHPIYVVGKGWAAHRAFKADESTAQLGVGDRVLELHSGSCRECIVESIQEIELESEVMTYCLSVDSHQSFFANGMLVHNVSVLVQTLSGSTYPIEIDLSGTVESLCIKCVYVLGKDVS